MPVSQSPVLAYDTTLRDGTQREGIALTCDDKIRIAQRLDALGVAFVEGGWPGSNPKDAAFFARARELAWKSTTIAAFGSTRRAGIAAADDPSVRALVDSGAPVCTIFGKSSVLHVENVLRTTREENLAMIEDTVAYLRAQGRRVVYDAEHFFDGHALDAAYAIETLRAAVRGGAEVVVLCDTNGGSMPWDVEAIVRAVSDALSGFPLGIHAHDDGGLAVANSLAAVRAGARHVQGTINGYGERCGNANLCTIIPDLELKLGLRVLPQGQLPKLYELARFVAEVANLSLDEHAPYVGHSAFAHKGGVHVAAMRREASSYQHVDPALVGNRMRVVVSELAGRGNVRSAAEELGLELPEGADVAILERIKAREAQGASFEAAEATVALMLKRSAPGYVPPFRLLDYKVMVHHREGEGAHAEATIKVAIGSDVIHTAAEGPGPVGALDAALRKALAPVYPAIDHIHLADYKVRILDGRDGTGATTRVTIESRDGAHTWTTVGASKNVIEASWHALADGIEFGLIRTLQNMTKAPPTGAGQEVA